MLNCKPYEYAPTHKGTAILELYECKAEVKKTEEENPNPGGAVMFGSASVSVDVEAVRRDPKGWVVNCPGNYQPMRVGGYAYVCYSRDYIGGKKYERPFAGFLPCQSSHKEVECPQGYSKRPLASLAADCDLHYCSREDLSQWIKEGKWPERQIVPLPLTGWSHNNYTGHKEPQLRVLSQEGVPIMSMSERAALYLAEEERRNGEEGMETRAAHRPVNNETLLHSFLAKKMVQAAKFSVNNPSEWQDVVEFAHSGASDQQVGLYLDKAIKEAKKEDESLSSV